MLVFDCSFEALGCMPVHQLSTVLISGLLQHPTHVCYVPIGRVVYEGFAHADESEKEVEVFLL